MTPTTLVRALAIAVFVSMTAGNWDAWWHKALGRLSNWEPPHLLLYAGAGAAICIAAYGAFRFRDRAWRRVTIALGLSFLSAPFDLVWHELFGVETVSSPAILWSPPHMFYIITMLAGALMVLPLVRRDPEEIPRFMLSAMLIASAMNAAFFAAGPLVPAGPFALIGFAGAAVLAALLAGGFTAAERWMARPFSATAVALFFLIMGLMVAGETISLISGYPRHGFPPVWLSIFAVLVPAACFDMIRKAHPALRGAITGGLMAMIMYVHLPHFIASDYWYGPKDALASVVWGLIGGAIGAWIVNFGWRRSADASPRS